MAGPDGDDADGPTPTTHYSLLDVPRDASAAEIEAAYRHQALTHHPDVAETPHSEEHMRHLNRARETLLDADKRAAYDETLAELGIDPHHGSPPGQTASARPPRRESIEYVTDRGPPADLAYPAGPFEDRVTNLAVRSWLWRTVLTLLAAVLVVETGVDVGRIGPVVPPLSTLLVAIALIFAADAVRVAREYPVLQGEDTAREPGSLLPSVRVGAAGALLWSLAVYGGGSPLGFAAHVVVPLTVIAVPVATLCRWVSLPRRLLLWISGAAGATAAVPFVVSAPAFVPADRFPVPPIVGTILAGGVGVVAVVAVGVALVFGPWTLSRLAWDHRCRSPVRVLPQVWEGLVGLPIGLAVLGLLADSTLPAFVDPYVEATLTAGMTPPDAGLVLVWTVPTVGIVFLGRWRLSQLLP